MDAQKQKSTINLLYIFLIASTIFSFMPYVSAQVAALALIIVTLMAAYYYRSKDSTGGLIHNHMTYMIGTIWIGGTVLLLGMMAIGLCLYLRGDHTLLQDAMRSAQSGIMPDEAALQSLTIDYMRANWNLIVTSSIAFGGPPLIYFIYRVANGYTRALKGYRIAKPKSWL